MEILGTVSVVSQLMIPWSNALPCHVTLLNQTFQRGRSSVVVECECSLILVGEFASSIPIFIDFVSEPKKVSSDKNEILLSGRYTPSIIIQHVNFVSK